MTSMFERRGAAYINDMTRSLGALLGIASGVLSDQRLADEEILFIQEWLANNRAISAAWPGDVIYQKVAGVLADGVVTEEERAHLVETLQQLIGGTLADLSSATHVTQMLPYEQPAMVFSGSVFCLTGDFVFGPRGVCSGHIERLGGTVKSAVSKKLTYLVIGGMGSQEWKHGSFGTKIQQAIELKKIGANIALIHEDHWASSLPRAEPA